MRTISLRPGLTTRSRDNHRHRRSFRKSVETRFDELTRLRVVMRVLVILLLRTYAIWDRSRWILLLVGGLYMVKTYQ